MMIFQVKWTLVVSMFCYTSYIAAQFYPRFYTLIPTAIVLGLGAAPLWSAKCSYITQVAHRLVLRHQMGSITSHCSRHFVKI